MSSLRRVLASKANGARSRGPSTPQGKQRSSQNAIDHGLLAQCVVLENESRETFENLLTQHLDRFRPADGVEFGLVEEMVASHWRLRRAWAMETRMLDRAIAAQPSPQPAPDPTGAELDRMSQAYSAPAAAASMTLMLRYQTRLHLMYQRALHNLLVIRMGVPLNPGAPNEPSPISGHSAETLQLPSPE